MTAPVGPSEAARRLGVSTRTVQRWLREGRLPAVRVGSRLKVDADALPKGAAAAPARTTPPRPIQRLIVANRGELVVRIARTCRRLGIRCLGLVPDDQARAWWTGAVDEPVPLRGSYLDRAAVIRAAAVAGADALHPGYGFLAENADFAEAVIEAGLRWVGPPPAAMRALGDKAAARRLAASVGVPVVPGYDGDSQSDAVLGREALRIGYPILVKPSGGGGGKGMHVVNAPKELPDALVRARRESRAAFDDDRLILERYLPAPRHVEVQILRDGLGTGVHLGERECSLQRRHQKVVEESPSPAVDAALRDELGAAALALARAAGYEGAGTAEFLLDPEGGWYFLELNARLQVEHPVTEMVIGRDLVADQLGIAAGEPLGFDQADVALSGHAIEARLYAEDPFAGFVPATGEVVAARWPDAAEGVRVDVGIGQGDVVSARYDPLLAKLIASGDTREEALARLRTAVAETSVLGVTTNRGFLSWLLEQPAVAAGTADTRFIDDRWQPPLDSAEVPDACWRQAAQLLARGDATRPHGGTSARTGFRLNQPARLRVHIDGRQRSFDVGRDAGGFRAAATGPSEIVLDVDGRAVFARLAPAPTVASAVRHAAHHATAASTVPAPMPGVVLEVRVAEGDAVEPGQKLVVLEAMKMENDVAAPAAARVVRVLVAPGQQLQRGDPLVELA